MCRVAKGRRLMSPVTALGILGLEMFAGVSWEDLALAIEQAASSEILE
jgi:hypothetical protein